MSALDWIFVAVLLASFVLGAWRGLVYEVLSVVSWGVAFVLAQWLAPDVGAELPMSGATEVVRYAVGFVLVFVATLFTVGLVAWGVKKLVESVGLRPVDRVLGAAFGLVRGVILLLAATVVMEMTPFKTSDWWQDAIGVEVSRTVLHGLKPMLPGDFGKYLP